MIDRQLPARRRRRAVAALITVLAAAGAPITSVAAADPIDVVFSFTGAEQSWFVPPDVSTIHVVLVGGRGGSSGATGRAHVVTGDLSVVSGSTLYVEVGGNGAGLAGGTGIGPDGSAGGFNGGGSGGHGNQDGLGGAGGGGASDLRLVSQAAAGSLDSRLIVAGGGGGRAVFSAGGSAGQPGSDGDNFGATPGGGGGAGTSTAGGAGGPGAQGGATAGAPGELASGGDGGNSDGISEGGGGGGGGYYGGGGGGGGAVDGTAGGGGGGSSYTGVATNTSVALDTNSIPSITISYVDPTPDTGVVAADVTVPASAACIELSATSVTFGTQRFGSVDVQATPGVTVTNCSDSDETLLARGTDATGTGAAWNLVDNAATCAAGTLGTDDFHLRVQRSDTAAVTQLSTTNKTIRPLAAGEDGTLDALLDMPCPGSSGAGQTMAMQIVFVVTE